MHICDLSRPGAELLDPDTCIVWGGADGDPLTAFYLLSVTRCYFSKLGGGTDL